MSQRVERIGDGDQPSGERNIAPGHSVEARSVDMLVVQPHDSHDYGVVAKIIM